MLQMRIYALYSLSKKILALMLVCFTAVTCICTWVLGTKLSTPAGIRGHGFVTPVGKFCVLNRSNPVDPFYTFWIPVLAFECLLCLLAINSGIQSRKNDGGELYRGPMGLLRVLVRDSVLYFIIIGATYLTSLLVWALAPFSFIDVPTGFSTALSCVFACRIFLNIRHVADTHSLPSFQISEPIAFVTSDRRFHDND
ncbi:hypothetical protein GALMADRAFT_798523 [Galerina marginata CBS 339.88]|uniref:Uncharacterized protein n=1 Tax=Galerina marginata (strain CBS 339.88) TaxID=685588 RepID=A0A067SX12_GALM3|nr:hypothetical protein GALMADRAFT_798523 [Galerina marginata CBS 339.88]